MGKKTHIFTKMMTRDDLLKNHRVTVTSLYLAIRAFSVFARKSSLSQGLVEIFYLPAGNPSLLEKRFVVLNAARVGVCLL